MFPIKSIIAVILVAAPISCYSSTDGDGAVQIMEIFTTAQYFISGRRDQELKQKVSKNYDVYVIDRISLLKSTLSEGLPSDAQKAKALVLNRFQSLDASTNQQLENAAKGLVKAMDYGVDRYPAIVFDGQAVIYGVTDIDVATAYYKQWREKGTR